MTHSMPEHTIPGRFEQQVRTHGSRLAIQTDSASISFLALNQTANRLARRIVASRGMRQEPIALLFEHGAESVAAMLAVLKAGKCYVVLDPRAPRERLQYILSHSEAALVITDESHRQLGQELTGDAIALLPFEEPTAGTLDIDLDIGVAPDDLATILYTSGSTGKPKGVMHTHRTLLGDADRIARELDISADDRWIWHTAVSFAGSARTIMGALVNGCALFPFDTKRKGLSELPDWLRRHEITIFRSVPTTFRAFMTTLPDGVGFPAVRVVSMGGEPLFGADVESFNRHFRAPAVLVHSFGPTECMLACWHVMPHGQPVAEGKVSIGRPFADITVLLLDEAGRPVGDGQIGEIVVKGPFLSPGYWRDPDQTRAVFVHDEHGDGARMYRTGDLGTRSADGRLTHVGRRDFQVKIRGFRIEVSEIETALRRIPGIGDAVVIGRSDRAAGMRLVAYIVPTPGTPVPVVSQLRAELARSLPDYMAPSTFVRLDALPQTPTGKTDRLRLPDVDDGRPDLASLFAPPDTPLEHAVLDIWKKVLGTTWLGIHDNFFEVGGDSLMAMRVVVQIQATCGVDLPLTELFEHPTVAATAAAVARRGPHVS
jgi:amino acid adenylation domain-containing protein